MKKRILALIISLLLALSFSACGEQSGNGNSTSQNTPNDTAAGSSEQDTPDGIGANGSGMSTPIGIETGSSGMDIAGIFGIDGSSLSFSSLTDFYNSQYRTLLEDAVNEVMSEISGLHGFVTVEEPDILIYNYQYTFPLSSIGLSHEEAAAITASNLQETEYSVLAAASIKEYQSCGIPLRVLRLTYLDADGSLVYSVDYTDDESNSGLSDSSGLSGGSGTAAGIYGSLQEWMDSSEDAALTVQSTNQALASTGITFDLTVDGNILVYQYYLPDAFFEDGLAEEEQSAAFDSMVDAGSVSADTVFSLFMEKYGLPVDAIRFVYCSKDGTELYSRDVTP